MRASGRIHAEERVDMMPSVRHGSSRTGARVPVRFHHHRSADQAQSKAVMTGGVNTSYSTRLRVTGSITPLCSSCARFWRCLSAFCRATRSDSMPSAGLEPSDRDSVFGKQAGWPTRAYTCSFSRLTACTNSSSKTATTTFSSVTARPTPGVSPLASLHLGNSSLTLTLSPSLLLHPFALLCTCLKPPGNTW